MSEFHDSALNLTRRHFFGQAARGLGQLSLGAMALSQLSRPSLGANLLGGNPLGGSSPRQLQPLHFRPKARRVIYLFQSGGPSQLETFDYKPLLRDQNGEELPEHIRRGQRLTGMSGNQSSLPLAGSIFDFTRHGQNGTWVSELLPHTAGVIDDLCVIKSMHTEAINHDPAITFFQTGSQIAGRPSIGSWLSYGLGSRNQNLPSFIVLVSKDKSGQPLYARLWGSGFLPSQHQGVQFRAGSDPVLYLTNPEGISPHTRRDMLDTLGRLHEDQFDRYLDPEIRARVAQYEMAYRMQTSVPEVTDLSDEPDEVFELYGEDSRKPGTYAANCLLARRLAERDVRFIQLFHQGWDQHDNLPGGIRQQCKETDQASAALIIDLKRRGLLDDTLVVWGGEFGRTNYSQGKLTQNNYGRDHHPRCFTVWMAGAGVRAGHVHGETDEYGYNITRDPVHVHDLQATILRLLGVDHEQLTHRYQGRRFRLTDVHGNVINSLLA